MMKGLNAVLISLFVLSHTQIMAITPPSNEATSSPTQTRAQPEDTLKPQEILDFWFGPLAGPADYPVDKVSIWFASSPEFDRQMLVKFGDITKKAALGELNHWRETPRGRLALILLLDQFPRHIYHDKPQAFASDAMARGLVLEGIQIGEDRKLYPVERAFYYLPLQHAEEPNMQNLSVEYYRQLVNESPPSIRPQMEAFLRYAILHQQIIAHFKRFPHRNRVLGRESTPEELMYINQQRSF